MDITLSLRVAPGVWLRGIIAATEASERPARLLVVDDNALVRDGLAALLTSWGYQTLHAQDVEEARSIAQREQRIDLAVVDYRLPANETALDAIAAIGAATGDEVRAVIITGDTHPQRIREASFAGHPVSFKPVPPDALRALLRRLLDEKPAATAIKRTA